MIRVARAVTDNEELAAAKAALERGYFGLAEKVDEFEDRLKDYLGAEYLVAVNSGTSAMQLGLEALGIKQKDEVIVPSLTFVASFQAISATGAIPVACDVCPDTLLMDIEDVKARITKKTKAIMPMHYAGNPCDMDALLRIKQDCRIRIIEDAAHALGSSYKGDRIGSFGDITCFSFDSIKNITCTEGGAVVCRDEQFADLLRQKRLLGIDRKSHTDTWKRRKWFYEVRTQGFRCHMSNLCAAIGLEQLKKIDSFIARRRQICKKYDAAFAELPFVQTIKADYNNVAPHIYVILVKNGKRDELMDYLRDLEIETAINYIPNHLHPFYRKDRVTLPKTEKAFKEILTLPLHCALSDEDTDKIIEAVTSFFFRGFSEMKVVILCGGKGTRLREETEYKPKPMVQVAGKPILWHIMKIYSHYGFNDFVLCLGYKQDVIKEYFLNYEYMNSDFTIHLNSGGQVTSHSAHNENWNVTLVNTGLETKKGTRVKMIEPYIDDDRFMLTYGDGLGSMNIRDIVDYHLKQGKTATFTGVHPISRFATVDTNKKGEIVEWSEKKTLEGYINAGFFVLERKIFDYLDSNCELEEEPMEQLAREKQVVMYQHDGFWHCMDTYRDYMFLEGLWQKGAAPWKLW